MNVCHNKIRVSIFEYFLDKNELCYKFKKMFELTNNIRLYFYFLRNLIFVNQ